mmetsp:Transcript_4152/g.15299  ORF Transcript_4152/g.15299 Transcript_4152/m.15299 type:complete len:125 (-) Transcript_4152:1848-2222(-)
MNAPPPYQPPAGAPPPYNPASSNPPPPAYSVPPPYSDLPPPPAYNGGSGGSAPPPYAAPPPHANLPPPPPLPPPSDPFKDDLPSGWQVLTDPEGRIYFYNSSTNTSQWQRPGHSTLPPPPPYSG